MLLLLSLLLLLDASNSIAGSSCCCWQHCAACLLPVLVLLLTVPAVFEAERCVPSNIAAAAAGRLPCLAQVWQSRSVAAAVPAACPRSTDMCRLPQPLADCIAVRQHSHCMSQRQERRVGARCWPLLLQIKFSSLLGCVAWSAALLL